MTAPNASTLWGRLIVGELVAQGVQTAVVAPGSRSTPLVVAAAAHPSMRIHSILDERSAGYFAVGRGKVVDTPTVVVTTSGTATANVHPAVLEAHRSRTPLLVCTADRPPELQGVGANQTVDQDGLYGPAVRYEPSIPEPSTDPDRQAALRNRVARAVQRTVGTPPGPVHLNVPFRKPLEPTPTAAEVPVTDDEAWQSVDPAVVPGTGSDVHPDAETLDRIAGELRDAARPVVVAGPSDRLPAERLRRWVDRAEIPVLADPLSGVRFGNAGTDAPVFGGYDAWIEAAAQAAVPPPDFVLRLGGRPTSKGLRAYLAGASAQEVLLDPAGGYRDPTHSVTEVVTAGVEPVLAALASRLAAPVADADWLATLAGLETAYWDLVGNRYDRIPVEGRITAAVFERAPPGAAVFVSNSMPVRDADRFGRPRASPLRVVGNRGVSGIDGITSTGLGVASVHDGPTVVVTGDLACYHDMTGLFTAQRCGIDATVVVINNDGGGIFHKLPIEDWEPPFTEQFKTPHGLEFAALAELYGIPYERVQPADFEPVYDAAVETDGTTVIEVPVDGARNHRERESFQAAVIDQLTASG